MLKSVGKRFLSIALVIVMVLTLLPVIEMSASAASVTTGVEGLTAESSGSATWTSSGGTINGSVAASVDSGCFGDTYSAQSGTLTFTNSSGGERMLSFDFTLGLNSGSATIEGAAKDAPGSFSKKLAAGETVAVVITSNASDENATTISISNMKLTAEQDITLTCKAPPHGSYTVNGTAVTAETQVPAKTTDIVELAATPAKNYKFLGWYNVTTGVCLSTAATVSLSFTADATIEPRFVASSVPLFKVGGNIYSDLNEAIDYATSSGSANIILISNGTLPAGSYTIPSGKTLLIPMDAAYTVVRSEPTVIYGSHANPSAYSILTMASGANITVQSGGEISLASKLCATGQAAGWNGTPTGPDGRINMQSGSTITVQNGGNLYAWGYIYGSGSVVAQSGATVHEAFQIKDWRGGTATSNCFSYTFIINQYYVQNIEVPLTLYAGATEKLYSSANASSTAYPMGVTFIGSNSGMFRITSGYLVKDYIEGTDRLQVDCYGNVSLSSMSMTGLPLVGNVNTESFDLPITSNITINIHDGSTASIGQNIKLLPSAEISVDDGASLNIASGKKVYVYDNDNWGNFTGSAKLYVIGYSVANGTTAKRTAAGLTDAKIDVNGTVNVSGNLYTSAGGANITSSAGTGKVVFAAAPGGNSTIYEMENNSDKASVTFTPARLHNGVNTNQYAGTDAEYTATSGAAKNDKFLYSAKPDKWLKNPVTVNWVNEDGTALCDPDVVEAGTMPKYTGATPTKADDTTAKIHYEFAGWTPELTEVTGDVTYKAKYDEQPLYYAVELYYDDAVEPVYTKPETLYKNSLKLTAEDPRSDGMHFSHWSIQYFDAQGNALGDAVAYNAKQITIHPGVGGITVKARAIYSENETTFGPFVKVIDAKYNPWTNKWSLTLTQSVPSGTATEVGFMVSTENDDTAGVIKVPSAKQLATNTFTAHVSMDGWEGKPLYARAYLMYGGETIYSDEPALVYPFPTE